MAVEQQPRMDIMQIFGDYIQLLGMIILATKLCLTKNCAGELMCRVYVYLRVGLSAFVYKRDARAPSAESEHGVQVFKYLLVPPGSRCLYAGR